MPHISDSFSAVRLGMDTELPGWLTRLSPRGLLEVGPDVAEADARVYPMRVALGIVGMMLHAGLAVVFAAMAQPWLAAINVVSVAIYAGVIFLVRRGAQYTAMVIVTLEIVTHVVVFTLLLGVKSGYLLYCFGGAMVPFMLFRTADRWWRIANSIAGLAPGPVMLEVMRHTDPVFALEPWKLDVLLYINGGGTMLALIGISAYFSDVNDRAELQLDRERRRTESLLRNILPESIVDRLKEKPGTIADGFDAVTVLFADLVGFSALGAQVESKELVDTLNEIISEFDILAERHLLEKIKTIGDAYMVVGGLPEPLARHAHAVAHMALDMQRAVRHYNSRTGRELSLRIGIHTGPVVAGVIGIQRFAYDLWGDTVNTASRMESTGDDGRIQVSDTTRELIASEFDLQERGVIPVKGKGEMRTWFLIGERQSAPA